MGDVMDHCNTMVEDIDSMLALCDKLIDLVGKMVIGTLIFIGIGWKWSTTGILGRFANLFGLFPFTDLQHYRLRH